MGGRGTGSGFRAGANGTATAVAVQRAAWDGDGYGGSTKTVPGIGRAQIDEVNGLLGTQVNLYVYDTDGNRVVDEIYTSPQIGDWLPVQNARDAAEQALMRLARRR